jgi:hypothetical protein
MVSSAGNIHAERLLIREDLRLVFDEVKRSPEETVSGTKTDDYLYHARTSDFMVVLLSQESRHAVQLEIKAALSNGVHIAAFTLKYPPFHSKSKSWNPTLEEKLITGRKMFVVEVRSVVELREQVWKSFAYFLSQASSKFSLTNGRKVYDLALDWLARPDVTRVALAQQTSMLVLGARRKTPEEHKCLAEVMQFITLAGRGRSKREFVHVFDMNRTLLEAEENSSEYDRPHSLEMFRSYPEGSLGRVHLASSDSATVACALVIDDSVALGTPLGEGGMALSVINDTGAANETFDMLRRTPAQAFDTSLLDKVEESIPTKPALGRLRLAASHGRNIIRKSR